MKIQHIGVDPSDPSLLIVVFAVERAMALEPDMIISARQASGEPLWARRFRDMTDAAWLPRGRYAMSCWIGGPLAEVDLIQVELLRRGPASGAQNSNVANCDLVTIAVSDLSPAPLSFENRNDAIMMLKAMDGSPDPASLSWSLGQENWFHRHFDHAARTIVHYFLKDSPLLQGRILDMGCGDGITDLAVALYCEPQLMIGVDPFSGFNRLPEIMAAHHVPADAMPPYLRFAAEDGNHLPFPDDSFDVVISWGSVEHIAGGYKQALLEIKRVLRDGGLLFIHPGLYYSNFGHHLGEFSNEPFFHLKKSEEELRNLVLSTTPNYMDRAGEFATPEQYWQWYKELNPITVSQFEAELRTLDFEPWRVALRTEDVIEYTPEILSYPIQDLATQELYMSCWNRKKPAPAGFVRRQLDDWFQPPT